MKLPKCLKPGGWAREGARDLMKDAVMGHELPALYRRACEQTELDERRVLFVNGKLDDVPDAFWLIMPYLEKVCGMDVRFIGLNQAKTSFGAYHARCRELVREIASARYVVLEDASDVVSCLPLRPQTKVVQLWHACGAFKKWGLSTAAKKFGASKKQIERHPFYGNLSLVTVSSPEVEWAYREAMGLEDTPEVVRPLGISRTDVFFDEDFIRTSRALLEEAAPGIAGRKVILYAPTFRGAVKGARSPEDLDLVALSRAIGDEYALVIKHHPFVLNPAPIDEQAADFAFMLGNAIPTDMLMCAADVLMTDYSSVVFEYALLDRPMLFFAPDIEDYRGWRDFYYDYEEMVPGPMVTTTDALIEQIKALDSAFDFDEVRRFRQKFMSACDGRATQRICESLETL